MPTECEACGGTGEATIPPYWHHPWPPVCTVCGGHGELEPELCAGLQSVAGLKSTR